MDMSFHALPPSLLAATISVEKLIAQLNLPLDEALLFYDMHPVTALRRLRKLAAWSAESAESADDE